MLKGDCLHPEFKDGEKVIFDKEAPLENGCFANFFYRPEFVRPGELAIQLKGLLIGQPPFVTFPWHDGPQSEVVPVIIVEQLNPHMQWSVRCSQLLAVRRWADDPAVEAKLMAEGWRI